MMLAMLLSRVSTVIWGCGNVCDVAVRELKADIPVPVCVCMCVPMCTYVGPVWRVVVGWYKMTPFSEFN